MFAKTKNRIKFKSKVIPCMKYALCHAGMIAAMLVVCSGALFAQQQHSVTGHVVDEDGEPLPGASVLIDGTTTGTTTDLDGNFNIDAAEDDVLVISYVGFDTQRVPIEGRSEINVVMIESEEYLDEVVVIGYGNQSRRRLTTSVSRVGSRQIDRVAVPTVANAIQGKVSGVRIHRSDHGGAPGAPPDIRIRGGSSITGSNSPLIIVDGIEWPNLRDLNLSDVESVDVLKDAASTSIYGSRASNGVILVTTKRGREGDRQFNVNVSNRISVPGKQMDIIGAEDYLRLIRPSAASLPGGLSDVESNRPYGTGNTDSDPYSTRYLEEGEEVPAGWKSMPDPIDPSRTLVFEDNDFQDLAFRTAWEQKYDLSVAGGSDIVRYRAGLGYTSTEGIAIGTNWENMSFSTNVDFVARDNITLSTNMAQTYSTTNTYSTYNDIFGRSIWLAPTARVYMPDGSYAHGRHDNYTNPLWFNDVNHNEQVRRRLNLGASLDWLSESVDGLGATIKADYFNHQRIAERYEKANIYDQSRTTRHNQGHRERVQTDGHISYTLPLDNHNLNLMAGGSYEYRLLWSVNTRASGAATDQIMTLNAAPVMENISTDKSHEKLLGMFSRVSYDYDEKYMLTLTVRRDASSRFAPENRVGYFPGVSAGWIISEENFFPSGSSISFLKLRSSLGQTGNVVSGFYTPFGSAATGRDYYNQAGVFVNSMPNFALGWETTTQRNIGLDLGLLNDRIMFVVDVYDRITDDLLFNTPLPRETGFGSIQQNVGSVKFYGLDFEASADIIENGRFGWSMDFNYSYNMNEVLSLPDNGRAKNRIGGIYNPELDEGIGGIAEGERMGAITGFESDFIIDNQEQADNANFDEFAAGYDPETGTFSPGKKFPGDMEWVDQTGDGRITQYDQIVLGYDTPHSWGGFTNEFYYGNISLSIHMDYTLGHSILDATKRRGDANAIGGDATPSADMLNSWQEEGDVAAGRATMPRAHWHDARYQSNIHRHHDRVVYRADFLTLREIMLTYQLPVRISNAFGLSQSSVYVQAQNLYYFTDYPLFNPEYEGKNHNYGGNSAEFPIPRKFIAGVSLDF